MRRVAYLSSAQILEGTGWDPSECTEHQLQVQVLADACRDKDIELEVFAWDDEALDSFAGEAVVVGTTWDYAARSDEFIGRLKALGAGRPLFNPLETILWNIDKSYLRELELKGVTIVPTAWCQRVEEGVVRAAFDRFETDHLVIKPTIGQTAWRQVQLRRGEALPEANSLPPKAAMIQPFQHSIQTEGESSFIFVDGQYSHCVRKLPADGDYRIQGSFGGTDEKHVPSGKDLCSAQSVIATLTATPLYARIDMVRNSSNQLALMECELIEPFLYPLDPCPPDSCPLGPLFAQGLERRLNEYRQRTCGKT